MHHKMHLTFGEALHYASGQTPLSSAHPDESGAAAPFGAPPGRIRAPDQALACASIVAASLTSNLPGPSTFSVLTTPSTTSIE